MKSERLWLILVLTWFAAGAGAVDISRRAFLSGCAAGMLAGGNAAAAPLDSGVTRVDASLDVLEMGVETVGITILQLALVRGWVRDAREAERTRWELQRQLWAKIQSAAVATTGKEIELRVLARVATRGGEIALSPHFRIFLGPLIHTERGPEKKVRAVEFLGEEGDPWALVWLRAR